MSNLYDEVRSEEVEEVCELVLRELEAVLGLTWRCLSGRWTMRGLGKGR